MARLTVKFGSKVQQVLQLDVDKLEIGRGSDTQLELDHELVSRKHCQLRLVHDGFVVEDLGSKTGTFVNNGKVQAHILQSGDVIGIGPYTLVYEGVVDRGQVRTSEGPAEGDPGFQSTGDFWAQAAADSGLGSTSPHTSPVGAPADDGLAIPASALGPRADGNADMDDYQGTLLASADQMLRVRSALEVSQKPHLTVRRKGKTKKLPLEDTTFVVGYSDDCDFRLPGTKFFGRKQFMVREIGDAKFEVGPLSFWANVVVDGERVRSGRAKLKNGSTIEAGGLKFRFRKGD